MKDLTIDDLLKLVKSYNPEEVDNVKKAYLYAENLHKGQFRQSGEEYISHPLNVAYILAEMHADCDTVCAGLLHDTIEDTNTTKEDIAYEFNPNVATLVDGVTKLAKMNFSSKQDQNYANTRKIITGITEDVRIIIIKLADRLHNMRTLEYKSEFKQKENALETMDIFVPLAYYIGHYRIKTELEDLAFRYLKPDSYKRIYDLQRRIEKENKSCLEDMSGKIKEILNNRNIPNEIKIRTKNIYGIYKRRIEGFNLRDIHDLFSLKLMVSTIEECYLSLCLIHQAYHPINEKFKDYICNPKTNKYQSLHTTVFGPDDRLVQTQIRTFDMDKVASFGLTSYWDIMKGDARNIMQKELKSQNQFYKSLVEINAMFGDNKDFVDQVKMELFSDNVYVYNTKGEVIQLPKGSSIIDFAYINNPTEANSMIGAYVNEEYMKDLGYKLKNKDRVKIITDYLSFGAKEEWENLAHMSKVKKLIQEGMIK